MGIDSPGGGASGGSPLVSVVMPSYNQAAFISAAMDSIFSQDYAHLELIVGDGGSTDGTVEMLRLRQLDEPRLRWFSRRDSGPAHAINDALDLVRGTVIGWVNSDDLYAPGAVGRAVCAFQQQPSRLMVYGQGRHVDGATRPLDDYPTLPPTTARERFSEGCFICQPTMFFRRTVPLMLGKLDQRLKASFDFDYWLRAFYAFQDRIGFIDEVQAYSRLHEDCITMRLRRTVALEGMQVLARHAGHAPTEWMLSYVRELLALDAAERGVDDLRRHIDETLALAAAWLRPQDVGALNRRLDALLAAA